MTLEDIEIVLQNHNDIRDRAAAALKRHEALMAQAVRDKDFRAHVANALHSALWLVRAEDKPALRKILLHVESLN